MDMAYESLKKNTSWSPAHQPAKENPFAPRPYDTQPKQDTDLAAKPDYSREAFDLICSRPVSNPNTVQAKSVPKIQQSKLESDGQEGKTQMDISKVHNPSIHKKPLSQSPSLVQRHFAAKLQAQKIQKQSQKDTSQSPNLNSQLAQSQGKESLLNQNRTFIEPPFGADISSVRLHTNSTAVQMSKDGGSQESTHNHNVNDVDAESLVRKANSDWKKVKATYLSQREIMEKIIAFREMEVQTIINMVKQQLGADQLQAEAFGSKDLTSDYDVTFNAGGNQPIEIQAVKLFNKIFRQRWGKESGTVFDTNVYTTGHMPVGQGKEEKEQYKIDAESQMTQRDKTSSQTIQDIMSLLKIRRFMSDQQWKQHKQKIINGINNQDERIKIRARLTEVDTIYKQANIQIEKKIEELNQDVISLHKRAKDKIKYIKKANPDAEMEASNRLYEDYLEKVEQTFQKIQKLKQEIEKAGLRTKQQSQKLSKLTVELQRLRSMALVFANEAYHTGGAVEHVVLNQQMELGISVTNQQYLQSINEQTGFAVEQINHSNNVGTALWKSSKYVDRLCDAINKIEIEGFTKPQDQGTMHELAKIMLKIKKGKDGYEHLKTDEQKSEEAKKIGRRYGYTSKEALLQAVLKLSQQANQEIRGKLSSEKKSK
jgi:hypothetical protein